MTEPNQVIDPSCIGGSDSAAICGVDPNRTGYQVALRITGQVPRDELDGLDHIEFGKEMEGVLSRFYERKHKVKLFQPKTIYHPKYPFLRANIDRIREDRMDLACEMKNTGLYTQEEWGAAGSDEVPKRVILQCHHYFACAPQITMFDVVRCVGGNTYAEYHVPRNEKLVRSLLDIELEFYDQVKVRGILPEPDWGHRTTKDVIKKAFSEVKGTIANMPELDALTAELELITAERLELEKQEEAFKNRIMHKIGNNEIAVLSDGRKWRRAEVHRKGYTVEPTSYLDLKLLKK